MSKNIVRVNKNRNYTIMSNCHLRDNRLSWKAKGIHSYILSLPDDWKVIIEHLKTVSTDGERSTRSGIKELYDLRYWQKYPVYVNGKVSQWVTEIYEEPFDEKDKIKSIVIRNDKKIINYEFTKEKEVEEQDSYNENDDLVEEDVVDNENEKEESKEFPVDNSTSEPVDKSESKDENLLSQNSKVDELIADTKVDLLGQNVDVGNVDEDNVDVEKSRLLKTNGTQDLSVTKDSINQSNKKDGLIEEKEINSELEILNKLNEKYDIEIVKESILKAKKAKESGTIINNLYAYLDKICQQLIEDHKVLDKVELTSINRKTKFHNFEQTSDKDSKEELEDVARRKREAFMKKIGMR